MTVIITFQSPHTNNATKNMQLSPRYISASLHELFHAMSLTTHHLHSSFFIPSSHHWWLSLAGEAGHVQQHLSSHACSLILHVLSFSSLIFSPFCFFTEYEITPQSNSILVNWNVHKT
ncbi:hypothetical protein DEO72_LG1g1405 [Vigna unguiculata]|uniref:Uncharacterized protein n=1 Tax=Vigna unguiculata TaxID=3917 RepID=A0A4D6KQ35_VIGUN|nr:hypothetical protein DEO72_LG1g1405 [Vigna unguiculata]